MPAGPCTHDLDDAIAEVALPGTRLWSQVIGSRLYGVATPESDIDLGFVYVRPTHFLVGLEPERDRAQTCEGRSRTPDGTKVEFVAHEVGKFLRLLRKGNPTMVEWLFSGPISRHSLWDELRARRMEFLTRSTIKHYLGYIGGQLSRLRKGLKLHTGQQGQYNTKWAYHMVRLCFDLRAILNGDPPFVTQTDSCALFLQRVRANEMDPNYIIDRVHGDVCFVEHWKPWDRLPEDIPVTFAHQWLLKVRRELGEPL